MTTKFSLEDDEKLIDMVQQREHLYSIANANYKNILMRKGAWSDISKVVGKSDNDCLKRWTTIKDYYNRVKKKGKEGSLLTVKQRMTRLNFLDETSSLQPRLVEREILDISTGEIKAEYCNDEMENVFADNCNEWETQSMSSASSHAAKRIKKSASSSTYSMIIDALNHNQELHHNEIMNVLQDISQATKQRSQTQHDSVDLFLQSIGQTIKQFPKSNLARVKLKILQVVTDMEERIC